MNDGHRDDQLEKLLEELRVKRETPGALRISDVEKEIVEPQATRPTIAPDAMAPQQEQKKTPQKEVVETAEFDFLKPEKRDKMRDTKQSTSTGRLARREIIDALRAGEEAPEYDPINKRMLAPTIERGPDSRREQRAREKRIAQAVEIAEKPEYTATHPLFTQSFSRELLIPRETEDDTRILAERQKFQTSEIILDGYVQRAEKKGVLNVKDNLDDNFREFFGDTVIIDHQPLSEKAQKQRKIKDYVIAGAEGGVSGPVFEDEEEDTRTEIEYESQADTEQVAQQLAEKTRKAFWMTMINGLLAAGALLLALLAFFDKIPQALAQPRAFYVVYAILVAAAVALNAKTVFAGVGHVFAFRGTPSELASFAAILALMEAGALLVQPPSPIHAPFGTVAIIAFCLIHLGQFFEATRVLKSFQFVSGDYDKYAATLLDDEQFGRRISRELEVNAPNVLIRRSTNFTDDFVAHAYSENPFEKKMRVFGFVAIIISLFCGVLMYLRDGTLALAIGVTCAASALCLPFAATLAGALPASRMRTSLARIGAVVPGYSAAQNVAEANCVVIAGREFFPKGNVMLHGIKTFDRERIDTAILYAASIIVQSCDTMSHMFMNVIQGKTDMLYPVESIEYEAGLGFSCWIDQRRILLGTRNLLEKNDIEVPSMDYENRYTKTNTRDAMYLAVGGSLYAMFVISYSANPEVAEALQEFEQNDMHILIHTRDFNITAARIARLYRIPESMVTVVRDEDAAELTRRTEYTPHAPSSLTHLGSLTSFIAGVSASHNLRHAARLTSTVEMIGLIIGLLVAVALTLLGSIFTVGALPILLFQLVWCLIVVCIALFHRY